jgi:chromate transporter
VTSFGGGTAAWLYRAFVRRRGWISDQTFLVDVGLSRLMPGSAGVNLTVQVGQRLRGAAGALTAVAGLLSGPFFIVIGLAAGYARIAGNPVGHAVLDGVAAAAIGLTFATGLVLVPRGMAHIGQLAITIATVLAVGVLRWPMLPVILCLAPLSIGLAAVQQRRHP